MEQKPEEEGREESRASNDNRARIPVATPRRASEPKKPSSVERLREARPSKKVVLVLMVAAAILTMLVGFNAGGWVTSTAAQQQITSGARDAVAARLTPICVAQFNLDPDKSAKLEELKAIKSTWLRPEYVEKQGWATMPGESSPDRAVATACASLLASS